MVRIKREEREQVLKLMIGQASKINKSLPKSQVELNKLQSNSKCKDKSLFSFK